VSLIYEALLYRDPDSGAQGWIDQASRSGGVAADARGIAQSSEFMVDTSPKGRSEIVQHFYRVVLGREIDPSGTQSYIDNTSLSYGDLLVVLLKSDEFQAHAPELSSLARK
jgi:hypothetical protein